MICCTDVAYGEDKALASAVLFQSWTSATVHSTYNVKLDSVGEYVSGSFFKRELPCLLKLLEEIPESLDFIIVDGFVWLDHDRPGLGHHLYKSLQQQTPVIGVAKRSFQDNRSALPVKRGQSDRPLWVTAVGCEVQEAAGWIAEMDGPFRNPTLLKAVDSLCREELAKASEEGLHES